LLLLFACGLASAADNVDITMARIELTDEGYKLNATYAFELNRELEDTIQHGVPLSFTTSVEITRPRWYWRDEVAASTRYTIRITYDPLLRQYNISPNGSLVTRRVSTLEDALDLIRRPGRWLVAPKGALKPGEVYHVTMQMGIDRELLAKPLQVNAFNNAGWILSSTKKTFLYKAE
jgi:hypothetical protein